MMLLIALILACLGYLQASLIIFILAFLFAGILRDII